MTYRICLLALTGTLVAASPASAAEVSVRVSPGNGVRLGTALDVTGRVLEGGAPLARRTVALEVRRYPFTRGWRVAARARTGIRGRYAFAAQLDRNHRVRVRETTSGAVSPVVPAYVLPAFTLSYAQRGTDRIRIRQVYTVPPDVRLRAPTLFYVGPRRGARAPLRARPRTRRVRTGRYVAAATVRIPAAYGRRFRYSSCFPYSRGSGMGDPALRCPRRYVRLR